MFGEISAIKGACVADQNNLGAAVGELRTTKSCKPLNSAGNKSLYEPQKQPLH
jgi:hypothetical protein